MNNAILTIDHAAKSFGENQVLKDISLSVSKGDVLALIGPSGSGKSTLLRCATLLETLDGGTLRYDDTSVVEEGVYAPKEVLHAVKSRFGLVFQNFNLFPHLSVMQNITLAQTAVLHRTREQAANTAWELLCKMGLAGKENAYPCELSGGQQQRVSIARALALDPEVLFFDEPTSALDPELTGEILKVIRGLAEDRMTMVIVTHEMAFARDVSDRVIFLDGGVVAEEGPSREVIGNPRNERTRAFLSRFGS